jgi:CheY-like chemotaxis protein
MLDERGKGFALGAAEYLVKPVDRQELIRAVRHVCPVSPLARKETVLAVDDDPMILEFMESVLTVEGFSVIKAGGGREGLQVARERHPDIIVLDLLMPDLDGFQVVDDLKHDPVTADIPIVILTARTLSPEDKKRLKGRVSNMTEKSEFNRAQFAKLLHSLLEPEKA